MRPDRRKPDELRPLTIEAPYLKYPEGSCLITLGETKVICTASIDNEVPPFKERSGEGWVTAEYAMLPRATHTRSRREISVGKLSGRTQEIQRLIGRSLRAVVDLKGLGERTILLDCDVIQADGGTRTAAVTGAFVALFQALARLKNDRVISKIPLTDYVAAVSVGLVKGLPCLDLCYEEDSRADVDMNFVMTASGKIIEVQGTAEKEPFSKDQLFSLQGLAERGVSELVQRQKKVLERWN